MIGKLRLCLDEFLFFGILIKWVYFVYLDYIGWGLWFLWMVVINMCGGVMIVMDL